MATAAAASTTPSESIGTELFCSFARLLARSLGVSVNFHFLVNHNRWDLCSGFWVRMRPYVLVCFFAQLNRSIHPMFENEISTTFDSSKKVHSGIMRCHFVEEKHMEKVGRLTEKKLYENDFYCMMMNFNKNSFEPCIDNTLGRNRSAKPIYLLNGKYLTIPFECF